MKLQNHQWIKNVLTWNYKFKKLRSILLFNSVRIRKNMITFSFSHELEFYYAKIVTTGVTSRIMDPKLESLDINCSTEEVAECIDRINFWIDTWLTSDEKAVKGAYLAAVGKEAFSLLRTQNLKGRFNRRNSRITSATC